MSRPNKTKIPTQPAGGGLFQAFAGLEISGLPEASPDAAKPAATEAASAAKPASKLGRVVLRRETAHRGGKCVIVVDGFEPSLSDEYLAALAKKLRAACGAGGTVAGRTLELQGDQPARIREILTAEGFRVAGVA